VQSRNSTAPEQTETGAESNEVETGTEGSGEPLDSVGFDRQN
jgi:hypothetical protein